MEHLIAEQAIAEIQGQIACADELKVLSSLPHAQAMTLLFSAKEALYKALYPSVRKVFDFSAAHAIDLQHGALKLRLSHAWGAGWPRGTNIQVQYAFQEGYVFTAICIPTTRL
jgi:enterobactin synthetase component D